MLLYSAPKKPEIKREQDTKWRSKLRIGINVSIICIETLFLAEYCAFGWVVGTFFWVFWFCFAIAWKFAGGRRRPSASSDPPANFQAIAKKIKISEKSANYQPNAQYQPKKRLYLYNRRCTFVWSFGCAMMRSHYKYQRKKIHSLFG